MRSSLHRGQEVASRHSSADLSVYRSKFDMGSSTKEAMLVRTRLTLFTLWAVTLCVLPGCTTQSDLTGISDTGAALRIAAFRGDLGEVNTLIENEASINAANKDGVTPL